MYVAWTEDDSGVSTLRVKRFVAGAWQAVEGVLNPDPARAADYPAIVDIGGTPYLAWQREGSGGSGVAEVASFNGTSWNVLPSPQGNFASASDSPAIAGLGGAPVVANYDQGVGLDVQVSLWDGSDWIQLGGPVNQTPAVEGDRPSLTVAGGVPFVAWAQAPPAAPFGG